VLPDARIGSAQGGHGTAKIAPDEPLGQATHRTHSNGPDRSAGIAQGELWQGAVAGRNLEARPVQTVCGKPGVWPGCFGLTEAAHKAVELRG
jgi:hypothetical protein